MRILRNLFTDHHRHKTVVRVVNVDLIAGEPMEELRAPTYLDLISKDDIDAAFRELHGDVRDVFVLWYVHKLSYRAISTRLEIPVSTVGTRLWRARLKLREILQANCRVPLPEVSHSPEPMVRKKTLRLTMLSSPRSGDVSGLPTTAAPSTVAPPRLVVLGARGRRPRSYRGTESGTYLPERRGAGSAGGRIG
jgi:hypothetical protein